MITLITPTQGNPIAFKRTVDSVKEKFGDLLTEVIVGDLCPFTDDRDQMAQYRGKIPVDIHVVPFDLAWIFNHGFSSILNDLALRAKNDMILYMNVSEVIEGPVRTELIIPQYTGYTFDHATDTNKWIRLYDKRDCRWSGRIHEIVVGGLKPCPDIIFRMADTEKDNGNPFRAWVYNWIKEVVYFQNYRLLVTDPTQRFHTDQGWINWAIEQEKHPELSFTLRINKHAQLLGHFLSDNRRDFIPEAYKCWQKSLEDGDPFKNTDMIHYQ